MKQVRLTAKLEALNLTCVLRQNIADVYQEEWQIAARAVVYHKELPLYQLKGKSTVFGDRQLFTARIIFSSVCIYSAKQANFFWSPNRQTEITRLCE